jgi:uncharacterized protein (TIGR00251 family)
VVEIRTNDDGVTFKVRVQPRASRTEITGEHNGAIKLRVAAPPVDGAANEECRRFIAKRVGVAGSSVEIVAGHSAREKVIRIHSVNERQVREALGRD